MENEIIDIGLSANETADWLEGSAWRIRGYIHKEHIRLKILFRQFSPITGYAPDPKREEWREIGDCRCCPAETVIKFGMYICSSTNNTATCRFREYRRILFRKFEKV